MRTVEHQGLEHATPEAGPARTAAYQPHLDGLRSIAVYLVVLFHAGVGAFSGGYVGVDVFFVLSGFLVTRVLLRDLDAGGSVRFARFYSRRFRRLLPAAFVALIGTALLVSVVDPIEAVASLGSFRAAFLYVANWYFIRQSADYFGSAVAGDPVLQFWSLAVEEQFYLLWPLLLAGLGGLARRVAPARARQAVLGVVVAGAVASLAWAMHLRTDDLNRAYFGTDARAYQLLAGAALALIPGLVAPATRSQSRSAWRVAAPIALVAIVAVGTSFGGGDAITRGLAATGATVVALVALGRASGGPAGRLLSLPPVVYLGRVSYGTYLWHWPVILLLDRALDLGPVPTAVVAIAVATGLASLSFQLLEHPVRASAFLDRHRVAVIGAGLTISVISGLVVVPAIVERPRDASAASEADRGAVEIGTPVPADLDLTAVYDAGYGAPVGPDGEALECLGEPVDRCTVVHGNGPRVLLLGDSIGQSLSGGLEAMAEQNDLTLSEVVTAGCPWPRDVYWLAQEVRDHCREVKEDAYRRVIPELDPDIVVLVYTGLASWEPAAKNEGFVEQLLRSTDSSIAELTAGGRTVVVIEPMPKAPPEVNPLHCLANGTTEPCRFLADATADPYEDRVRQLAASDDHVVSIDLDPVACPYLPICDPIIGGVVVRWDNQHLTAAYSRSLGDALTKRFRQVGVIA